MKSAIIAFTERGVALMKLLGHEIEADCFTSLKYVGNGVAAIDSLAEWSETAFPGYDALVFIGATGIAVRAIAPHVRDKATDPAVVVIDEFARHVIPILSGHIGGANELAVRIGEITGAEPVVTTATDLNGIPAIDTWAVKNNMAIENAGAIKHISSAALRGEPVGVAITERMIDPPFPVTLFLRPRTLTVGMGCKRGIDHEALEGGLHKFLELCGVSLLSVAAFATIDRKADEPAFLYLPEKYRIPLVTYTAEELRETPGVFTSSEWVQNAVGVDNVCERAAVRHSGGTLLMGKTIYEGMTFALAFGEVSI